MEKGEIPTGLDVYKAFDHVDHIRLLNKLERYGIRGVSLRLPKSYLKKRRQLVVMDCTGYCFELSEALVLEVVFQGSILGPLLFVVYIDDFLVR